METITPIIRKFTERQKLNRRAGRGWWTISVDYKLESEPKEVAKFRHQGDAEVWVMKLQEDLKRPGAYPATSIIIS